MDNAFFIENEKQLPFPSWFKGFVQFTAQLSQLPEATDGNQDVYVFSAPRADWLMTAASLGTLYVEVARIKSITENREIKVEDLQVGMIVSVVCGNQGNQQADGEVTDIDLEDRRPRIRVAGKTIGVEFIKSITSLSDSVGEPKQFKKRNDTISKGVSSIVSYLLDSSIPINRSLVTIRATSSIIERELALKVQDDTTVESMSIKELIKPINLNTNGTGLTTVFNSNEDENYELLSARNEISRRYLDAPVAILSGASAVSAQINAVQSRKVIGIIGRNERMSATASLAIRDAYAYSYDNRPSLNFEKLPKGIEFLSFGRGSI